MLPALSFFARTFDQVNTGSETGQARRWATARLMLGVLQMVGATLLAASGVMMRSLGVVLATTVGTAVSVLPFGARSR